jgi:hypothetical protein
LVNGNGLDPLPLAALDHADALTKLGFGEGSQVVLGYGRPGYFVSDTSHPRETDHVVLAIEWDGSDEELDQYAYNRHQWPPHGNPYREWLIPGDRLNHCRRYVVRSPNGGASRR